MAWRMRKLYDMGKTMTEMEDMFNAVMQGMEVSGLLRAPEIGRRVIPALRGSFRVDVREHDEEVIVAADMPGIDREKVSIRLRDPRTLEISSKEAEEREEEEEGYFMRERVYGTMSRVVTLPADVSEEDAAATFTNGVLEIRLKKIAPESVKEITIT